MLVQERKSSPYVLNRLVPALRRRGLSVEVQDGWIDDLVGLFNRSTVYLYDPLSMACAGIEQGLVFHLLKP